MIVPKLSTYAVEASLWLAVEVLVNQVAASSAVSSILGIILLIFYDVGRIRLRPAKTVGEIVRGTSLLCNLFKQTQ
jgi:hypothetical protein